MKFSFGHAKLEMFLRHACNTETAALGMILEFRRASLELNVKMVDMN